MDMLLNVAGWVGGLLAIVAYGLLSLGTAVQAGAVPNAAINVVWVVFGLYALARKERSGRPRSPVSRGESIGSAVNCRGGSLECVHAGHDVAGDG
jgi:hypothetical protein